MYYHSIKKLKTKYSSIKDWAIYENAIYNEILCKCKKMYKHIARKKVHTILRWKNQVSMLNKGCSLVAQTVKNLPAMWETRVQSLGWEDALERRESQPTPVFLPGEFHEQRSLVGYNPWSHKQSDTSEQLILSLFIRKPISAWAWNWHSSIFERINEWILLYPFANSPNIIWTMQPPDKISIA